MNQKAHYIQKGNLVKPIYDRGLQAIDFECLNGTLKLKSFLKHPNKLWFHIPSHIFSKLGRIDFLPRCDFDFKKLQITLSLFNQQVLRYWRMLYKHNFSPNNTPIWNCHYITTRNKLLYNSSWMEHNIWSIRHLFNNNGSVMKQHKFISKYNIQISTIYYKRIISVIPNMMLHSTSQIVWNLSDYPPFPSTPFINGKDFKTGKKTFFSNCEIRL